MAFTRVPLVADLAVGDFLDPDPAFLLDRDGLAARGLALAPAPEGGQWAQGFVVVRRKTAAPSEKDKTMTVKPADEAADLAKIFAEALDSRAEDYDENRKFASLEEAWAHASRYLNELPSFAKDNDVEEFDRLLLWATADFLDLLLRIKRGEFLDE